jgi:nucleoid-associated protein YgaU
MEKGMHLPQDNQDWALSETQVFVPELLQREYFSSTANKNSKNVERRKPLFGRSQFGVEAASLDVTTFTPRTGLLARAGASPVGSAMNTYEVVPGDTLGTISKKIYGTPGRWMELAHLNHLGNGSLIYPKEILFYIKESQVIGQHE